MVMASILAIAYCAIVGTSGCVTVVKRDEFTIKQLGGIKTQAEETRDSTKKALEEAKVDPKKVRLIVENGDSLVNEIEGLKAYEEAKTDVPDNGGK